MEFKRDKITYIQIPSINIESDAIDSKPNASSVQTKNIQSSDATDSKPNASSVQTKNIQSYVCKKDSCDKEYSTIENIPDEVPRNSRSNFRIFQNTPVPRDPNPTNFNDFRAR